MEKARVVAGGIFAAKVGKIAEAVVDQIRVRTRLVKRKRDRAVHDHHFTQAQRNVEPASHEARLSMQQWRARQRRKEGASAVVYVQAYADSYTAVA